MSRVLIIEDTQDIAAGVRDFLVDRGYEVRIELDGTSGLAAATQWAPDVILLDLRLPDISGYEVLQRIRHQGSLTPVLILSATTDEVAKVRGFREGADDYVTKPFGLRELAARVQVLARRATQIRSAPAERRFGALAVQFAARRALVGGNEVHLRPKEFDLLVALLEQPDEVRSRLTLLAEVWAYEPGVESRTVDWHIAELRRKIGDDPVAPTFIETIRGSGYRWVGGRGQ